MRSFTPSLRNIFAVYQVRQTGVFCIKDLFARLDAMNKM